MEHTKTAQNNEQYKDFEDITEEESIDRLWVVVRSLKNAQGKIVNTCQRLIIDVGLQDQEV